MSNNRIVVFSVLACLFLSAFNLDARYWTSAKSKKKFEADFIAFDGTKVYLKRKSGKIAEVGISIFTTTDQRYVYAEMLKLSPSTSRTWRVVTPSEKITARYVRTSGKNVVLRLKNGKSKTIPITSLSYTDQRYAANIAKEMDDLKSKLSAPTPKSRTWTQSGTTTNVIGRIIGRYGDNLNIMDSRRATRTVDINQLSSNSKYYADAIFKKAYTISMKKKAILDTAVASTKTSNTNTAVPKTNPRVTTVPRKTTPTKVSLQNPRVWTKLVPVKSFFKADFKKLDSTGKLAFFLKEDGNNLTTTLKHLSKEDQKYICELLFKDADLKSASWSKMGTPETFEAKMTAFDGVKVTFITKDKTKLELRITQLIPNDANYIHKYMDKIKDQQSRTWSKKPVYHKFNAKLITFDGELLTMEVGAGKKELVPFDKMPLTSKNYLYRIMASQSRKLQAKSAGSSTTTQTAKNTKTNAEIERLRKDKEAARQKQLALERERRKNQNTASYTPSARKKIDSVLVAFLIMFGINTVMYTLCLWLAMLITKCESSFLILLASASVAGLVAAMLPPFVDMAVGGIIQFVMIKALSKTSVIDTGFMIIVGNLFYVILFMAVVAKLLKPYIG